MAKKQKIQFASVALEDPRETNGRVFKRRNGEEWQISETHYLLNGHPEVPLVFDPVDIDDETGIITYESLSFPFCPRGYFVSANGLPEVWCPIARIAIAVLKNKNNPVVETHDERNQ
jgi:hypothetical protein